MRLSTKGRYALTTIMDLTLHQDGGPVTLADISQRQSLSLSYLEQLFADLRRDGLVHGMRGPGGGYRLARAADTISVAAVIMAVDPPAAAMVDDGGGHDDAGNHCITHDLWSDLSDQIRNFLAGITLADLAADPALVSLDG